MQVTRLLRNTFMLTYSTGTRYPDCASSIHTTYPQDLVGASQQILCFYICPIQAGWVGHKDRLYGVIEKQILRITKLQNQIHDNNPLRTGLHSAVFIVSFLSMPPITPAWDDAEAFTRKEGYTGACGLIHHLYDKLPDSG